ncbi:MAG: M28 family peptidase [Verrucomicrobiota bacterium]
MRTTERGLLVVLALATLACGPQPAADSASGVEEAFDQEQAFADLAAIVGLGPRTPGSPGLQATRDYLLPRLQAAGWSVQEQAFLSATPRGEIEFVNVRARFGTEDFQGWDSVRAILGGHIDTKFYDEFVFVGANDAGSSTALLLEAARALATKPELARQVELVWFDGEEAIVNYTATDGLYGSRFYARELRKRPLAERPAFGLIVDMVADKNLRIALPSDTPGWMREGIFRAAREVNAREVFRLHHGTVLDDHVPLQQAGVPMANLIQINLVMFPSYWHTAEDTLDKLSAESLGKSARTALRFLENFLLREPRK